MFCGKCGRELSRGNKFCIFCGTPLDSAEDKKEEVAEPVQMKTRGGRATSFLSSPGGIVLVISITLIVVVAVVAVAILVNRDGGQNVYENGVDVVTRDDGEDSEAADPRKALGIMEEFLEIYVSGGWCAGGQFMTAVCYEKFCGPNATAPPPEQGDFTVMGAEVDEYEFLDEETILFKILQRDRLEDGGEDEYIREFEMIREDGTCLVNDCYKLEP